MKKHIILDIISMWCFLIISIIVGLWVHSVEILVVTPLFLIWFSIRTFRWIVFLYDKIFKKTVTVHTKGYRFLTKERIYALDFSKKIHYSVVVFDDSLKGKYILLDDNRLFKQGELLEITYYKNSKVIKSILKL